MKHANIQVFPRGETHCARDTFTLEVIAEGEATSVLTAALAALPPGGGEVRLAAGEFRLTGPLVVGSRVALRGAGRATRLIAAGAAESAIELNQADGALLSDIAVVAAEGEAAPAIGITLTGCGDCRVTGVFVKGFARFGLLVQKGSFLNRIECCAVAGCGEANYKFFQLGKDGRGGDYLPNLAQGCTAYGGGVGFAVEATLVLNLVGCMVHQAKSHGFHLWSHSNSVLLSGCRTFQVGGNAVLVHDSNELNISSSIFCWTRDHGILLRKVSWGVVSGNNVIDAGVRAADGGRRDGIRLAEGSEGLQITGNALFSWGDQVPMAHGVFEDETCRHNAVRGNNLNFYRESEGFVTAGSGSSAGENVAVADPAYRGNPNKPFPDFTNEAIDAFIAAQ